MGAGDPAPELSDVGQVADDLEQVALEVVLAVFRLAHQNYKQRKLKMGKKAICDATRKEDFSFFHSIFPGSTVV